MLYPCESNIDYFKISLRTRAILNATAAFPRFDSLKEENQRNALVSGLFYGLCVRHQSGIFHLLALVLHHVQQSEVEPHFGAELEVGQIAVATHRHVQTHVDMLEDDRMFLLAGNVEVQLSAQQHVGSVVVQAARCHLETDGQTQVVRFQGLRARHSRRIVAEMNVARHEVQRWREAQVEVLGQCHIPHQTYTEGRVRRRTFGTPTVGAAVHKGYIAQVDAQQETIVHTPLVDVGQVLEGLPLSQEGQTTHKYQQQENNLLTHGRC